MTTRKMAVFHYPRAVSEKARWRAFVAEHGSRATVQCVGVYETSSDDWRDAQASAIRQAKADAEALAVHASRNLAPRALA